VALRVASNLRNPGRAEEPDEQRAADRREQQRYTKRDMAARAEIADLDAVRVLEDEDQQQNQNDRPGHKATERSRRPSPRRLRLDLPWLARTPTGGRIRGHWSSRTFRARGLGWLGWGMLACH
jgi:hypothetical protein